MQQSRALLLLVLITAAAAKSSGTQEGAQAAAAEPRTAAPAPPASESLRHQYLPEDTVDDVAGDAFPGQSGRWFPRVENTSNPRSWRDAFMKVYAASYLHFAHAGDDLPPGPEHARDARNITDLKKWKARQEAAIKAFVPKEFKQAAREAVEGSFRRRASELEAEQEAATKQTSNPAAALPAFLVTAAGRPMKAETEVGGAGRYAPSGRLPHVSRPNDPMAWKQAFLQEYAASYMEMLAAEESVARQHPDAPAHARDCHNISELRGWRHAQEARIKAFVPEEFQKMAAADVERKFEKRQAALADEGARQPQQQARQLRKEAPSAGDAHSGKAADSKRDTASAKKQEERAVGDANSGKAADSKQGTTGAKQEELAAGDAHSGKPADSKQGTAGAKQEAPQRATVLAALPRGRGAPLLAAVGLLASLATGALVARRRMQRTLDLGSYLLANEA